MISSPWLALIPCILCMLMYRHHRQQAALWAAIAWAVYLPYEWAMHTRILCSGECNIRVDLLLIYPILLALSLTAIRHYLRARRRRQ